VAEAVAVLCSPLVAFYVLRLRPMAPNILADSNIHTAYIVHPRDFLERYSAILRGGAGLRELGRPGFLVPAHAVYLVVGAVPEFYVMRYVFALVAVVPTYLLLRRLYGSPAGVIGIILVMSSPVIVTAWGTDYPDSAVVSYLAGSIACLGLSLCEGRRRLWLTAAAVFATMALWSHSVAIPLLAVMIIVYLAVRIATNRDKLMQDMGIVVCVALGITLVLGLGSELMFGRSDFISLSWSAYRFYSQPVQVDIWHTSNFSWLSAQPYLLVPPAVIGAWLVIFAHLRRSIPKPQLLVGLICIGQTVVFSYMQFLGKSWTLEQHYVSSTLFAGVTITLAVILCELGASFWSLRIGRWIPPVLVLSVPLIYEAGAHPPSFTSFPIGVVVAALLVAAVGVVQLARRMAARQVALGVAAIGIVLVVACMLFLVTTPIAGGSYIPGTAGKDPVPGYDGALGGSGAQELAQYRIATQLPGFVGSASYPGEQLMMWVQPIDSLIALAGMYHGGVNMLYPVPAPPVINSRGIAEIDARHPAEILILSTQRIDVSLATGVLHQYQPRIVKYSELRAGRTVVYAWLVELEVFASSHR